MNKTSHRCFALITVIVVLYSINGILCRSHHYDSYNEDNLEARESSTGPISEPDWFEKYMQTNECGKHKTQTRVSTRRRGRKTIGVHHGRDAFEGEFPSYVGLNSYVSSTGFSFGCGGTLLTPDLILTAAHCVFPMSGVEYDMIYAISGTKTEFPNNATKTNTKRAARSCISDEFNTTSNAPLDIAVVRLYDEFELNENVNVACLADRPVKWSDDIQLAGKGMRYPNNTDLHYELQAIGLHKIECKGSERDFGNLCTMTNERNGRGGACRGDSGGPLYIDDHGLQTVVGMVSWGDNKFCEDKRFDSFVNANAYVLRDRILDLIRLCADDKPEPRKHQFRRSTYADYELKTTGLKLD